MASEKAKELVENFGHYIKYDAAYFDRHDADEHKEKLLNFIGELEGRIRQFERENDRRELIDSLAVEIEQ